MVLLVDLEVTVMVVESPALIVVGLTELMATLMSLPIS
jgi:hypothetical protein